MLKAVLLDLSGVLYQGNSALPGAVPAVQALREAGLPLRFVTNTSRRSQRQLLDDLARRGFQVHENELFSAPRAAGQWLRQRQLRPWCLIHPDLEPDFADLDQHNPNAVLVGDAAQRFDYHRLDQAFRLLEQGAPLVATGINRHFQLDDGLHLDAGPFVRALEYAADCRATVTGKPSPSFFAEVMASLDCPPGDALMVGDDALNDVQGALDAGLQGALVSTGKYRRGDEQCIQGDFLLCPDLAALITDLKLR